MPREDPLVEGSWAPLLERYAALRRIAHEVRELSGEHARARILAGAEELLGRGDGGKLRTIRADDPRAWDALQGINGFTLAYLSDLLQRLVPRDPPPGSGTEWVGCDPRIRAIRVRLPRLARGPDPVFLIGERGVGKNRLARALHAEREGPPKPFYAVSAADFGSGDLVQSRLFGHVKGSFTSAVRDREGLLARAHRLEGTLLWDDVGNFPPAVQRQLLVVMQDGTYFTVGSDELKSIGGREERRVKICAATQPRVIGKILPDLRDRLAELPVLIPPLRERGLDVLLLADREVERIAEQEARAGLRIHPEAWEVLLAYTWPGNVRQEENVIRRAVRSMGQGGQVLGAEEIERAIELEGQLEELQEGSSPRLGVGRADGEDSRDAGPASEGRVGVEDVLTLEEVERRHIQGALRRSNGNITAAAKLLGIARTTLYSKMKAVHLKRPPSGDGRADEDSS